MTNSEIKKCEHIYTRRLGDMNEIEWCGDCGAQRGVATKHNNYIPSDWQHPRRTPEPTKAENKAVDKIETDWLFIRLFKSGCWDTLDDFEKAFGKEKGISENEAAKYLSDKYSRIISKACKTKNHFATKPKAENGLVRLNVKEVVDVLKSSFYLYSARQVKEPPSWEDLAYDICDRFGTPSITKESELVKDKYFTYRGMRADGEFYIEFKDGWPKKMIPNFKEQLLAILPEEREHTKICQSDPEVCISSCGASNHNYCRNQMKQRIEELWKA